MIKNFGRIESADISFSNLVVFAGNNNSGKTMVMQLMYGIQKELGGFSVPVSKAKKSELSGQYLIRCDWEWFRDIESQINKYLAAHKAQITESIFGVAVPAEEIKIALEGMESEYFVSSISEVEGRGEKRKYTGFSIDTRQFENGEDVKSMKSLLWGLDSVDDAAEEALGIVWRIILSGKGTLDSGQLFLPASRSGLQLLYKHYFVGGTEGNLVMPIKEFLQFLQLYAEDMHLDEGRKALLEFGEAHLLDGKVVQKGDETFYIDKYAGEPVSLYLASSMIHELAPFIKALSGTQKVGWLYCDEAENSLHPLLQREMARWLIRMVNAGMHVIVSTHSDTMASRLNNLFMLAHFIGRKADYGLMSELKLKDADLLHPGKQVAVYEFRNGEQGKTIAEKLEFISHPLMGYDFQLFGSNLDKLYDEAEKITR